MTATAALVAGAVLTVLVAVPSTAAAIRTAHLLDSPPKEAAVVAVRPEEVPTPTVAYEGPLIAPIGWSDITRAQLHAHYFPAGTRPRYPANAAVSERQEWLVKQCMAQHGFLYDPFGDAADLRSLSVVQRAAFRMAQYGPPTDAPYDWRTAGCVGRAVHLTGQDGAH